MQNFIVDHAVRNVWCSPDQDTQVIIEPARLTPTSGVLGAYKVMWRTIDLPDNSNRWHVYQIGQIHPLILGLFPKSRQWVSFSDTCNAQKMICDIYTKDGISIPRFETYYMYNGDRDLIIAVKKNDKLSYDFNHESIFIRVYSNEYFNSLRSDNLNDFIHVEGLRATSVNEILAFQNLFNTYTARPGKTYAFVNGVKVKAIDLLSMVIGDVGEFVYDSSIYKVLEFKLDDLSFFESSLDSKRKYLLHYLDNNVTSIDYQDDIDVFVILKKNANVQKGLYYHKNNPDAMRMVTHRDYSISTAYVQGYISKIETLNNAIVSSPDMYIQLHIRKSGWLRPLVFENNRISELYKMNDIDVVRALLGIDAVVPNWRAENLENSSYTRIMSSSYQDITPEMVQEAYGYNAISKVLADTPVKPFLLAGNKSVLVPYLHQIYSTAYEYNSSGVMIGWYLHSSGSLYHCVNQATEYVEFVSGIASDSLDETYNVSQTTVSPTYSYKVYTCRRVDGVPNDIFIDATANTHDYTLTSTSFVWHSADLNLYPVLRSDRKFIAYDLQLNMNRGMLKFTINTKQTRNGITGNWEMLIPLGEIDVFLNGKSLIRDLDYKVVFPNVVITNKEYLVNPLTQAQNIHVRFVGFCNEDLTLSKVSDYGFIEYGLISNNKRFDIRDDRVLRITLDGALKTREELIFSETNAGTNNLNLLNGRPYQIRDMISPLMGLTPEQTYSLRAKAKVIDKSISDYLTMKLPQTVHTTPNVINQRYAVFSPFCNKLIYDLSDEVLSLPDVTGDYGRQFVMDTCKSYEYLLDFDPTQRGNEPDSNYVVIHPHSLNIVIDLNFKAYKFMQEVVNYYTDSRISLSAFVQIV